MKRLLMSYSLTLLICFVLTGSTSAQCPESFVFDSVEVSSFDGAGDVNNDGYDDIIIGSSPANNYEGAIYIHSGETGLPLNIIRGNKSKYGTNFGSRVGGVGDINEDGYDDYVGTAKILASGELVTILYSGFDASIIREMPYGLTFDAAGDVNNDGTPDILIGYSAAQCELGNGSKSPAGRVVVISGADGSIFLDLWGICNYSYYEYNTKFGESVAGMGDLNDDGYDDFAVGIPKMDVYSGDKFLDHGEVRVYSGIDGEILHKWHAGMAFYDLYGFGTVLDNVGDVDKDGYNDIIIGHVGPTNSIARRDSAWVFSGKYDPDFLTDTLIFTLSSNDNYPTSYKFGTSVSSAGDVNLDGYPDIAVGDITRKKIYIFSGVDGSQIDSRGGTESSYTGGSLAFAGDLNGDGKGDILSSYENDYIDKHVIQAFICIFPEPACIADVDTDEDGLGDLCDNCPNVANYNSIDGQPDADHDGIGDACDDCTDSDYDGYGNPDLSASINCIGEDNCPKIPNPGQEDSDGDGVGDPCDGCPDTANSNQADTDDDGIQDACDICPDVSNPTQVDSDDDGYGDHCDNCSKISNPGQENADGDNRGDLCDNCPDVINDQQWDNDSDGIGTACDPCTDYDQDGYGAGLPQETCEKDNCNAIYNPDQSDVDEDGIGDLCDNCPDNYNPGQEDRNYDGFGDACVDTVVTPEGTDVEVDLGSGVSLTIGEVGFETITEIYVSDVDDPPAGEAFSLMPGGAQVYHIEANGGTYPPYTVCINYDDAGMDAATEARVALWHFEYINVAPWVDGWVNVTTTLDTVNNTVCGETQSLSPFAPGLAKLPTDIGVLVENKLPVSFALKQNYPNPFNPETIVEYSVIRQSHISIKIFNIAGQKVRTLVNESVPAGIYRIIWDGRNDASMAVASGIYLYRFQTEDNSETKKMILLK